MLKRKITKKLEEWKKEPNKPCLLVRGARQVGKTFIIEKFAKENYKNYIYINFELMPEYKKIFDGNLDYKTLKMNLEVYFPEKKIEKGDTILFLDEIQACPNARVALKSFALDGTIDVIASGSLLGLYYKDISSYPVGYERSIELYPLDFEEFLWALGISTETIDAVKDAFIDKNSAADAVISKFSDYFKTYMLVGGMPAVVNTYLETESLQKVIQTQRALVDNYKNDVVKYASTTDKQKILMTFDSVPMQLAKKNKKFLFSDIDARNDNASERKYGSSVAWLKDAGVVNFCYNLNEPAQPLSSNRKLDSYKIYIRDVGLLVSMLENGVQKAILEDDLTINEGSIAENVCAEELAAHGYDLTYFERRGKLEIDFVQNIDGIATAIEIKSGNTKLAKSLISIKEHYKTVSRYIMFEKTDKITIDNNGIEHYPLFMIMFI